ncbi:MAG TPA: hypothetical protein VK509_07560 [Polyangiales bacterium]|nr:hypothetical protein [Polyangiales bacterium]
MARQFSVAVRNARAAAIESTIGASPTLEIRTGPQPADCATADSGSLLASLALPADWLGAPVNGVVSLSGTWQDLSADAPGTAAHYRIKQGASCHEQGSVSTTGGGGDLQVNNTNFAATQPFSITAWSSTEGGA